jgi:hypothetical protein
MVSGAVPVDAVWAAMGPTGPEAQVPEKSREQAFNAGRTLVRAWEEKRRFTMVEKVQEEHRKRMQELINWYQEEWPYEYRYWKERA